MLNYDDGIDSETYGLIDNANSNTRAGLRYDQDFGDWHFENVNEIGYAPFSTDNTSIIHQSPDAEDWEFSNGNIRKLDFTLEHDRYGKFWLGQGSMATDGVYEIDLSGTTVIDYSSVADSASAQIIRFSDPGLDFDESLSGITIGNAFTNYDGPRRVRIRYDTPEFNGFVVAAAYGRNLLSDDSAVREENIFDASVTYGHTYGDVEVKGGLGYYWEEDDTRNWGGSASALHTPTGLNATLAVGGAGHRRRRRQLLVRQARATARLRRLGRHRGRGRLLFRRRHLPRRRRRHHQLVERLARRVAGAEHRPGQHRALAHLPHLRLLRQRRQLRGRAGDLRRRALQVLIPAAARKDAREPAPRRDPQHAAALATGFRATGAGRRASLAGGGDVALRAVDPRHRAAGGAAQPGDRGGGGADRRCGWRAPERDVGQLTELVIALTALQAGQHLLVKASIAGAIVTNTLFMLGGAFLLGGLRHHVQTFNRTSARLQASLLFLARWGCWCRR